MQQTALLDLFTHGRRSAILAFITLIAILGLYVVVEPVVTNAISADIVINQTVTSEISFLTAPSNIDMASLAGITGGTATGSTQLVVYTNDSAGYNMTLIATASPAMQGAGQGGTIPDFSTSTTQTYLAEPALAFTVPSNRAGFGYTVKASTTSDLDTSFLSTGSDCNQGGGSQSEYGCWIGASSTANQIINRNSETTASGATTTIFFKTVIMPSPSPSIPEDEYYATTTLTAVTN